MEVERTVERYLSEAMEESPVDQELLKKGGSPDAGTPAPATGCFDCNICLDFAVDPVVTLCGHLYCWPCIYKWLQQVDRAAPQQCPVCKATVSENSLVPLYGRGQSTKNPHQSLKIPRRPAVQQDMIEHLSPRTNDEPDNEHHSPIPRHNQQHYHVHQHEHHHHYPYSSTPMLDYMSPSSPLGTAGGVLEGMVAVLPRVFRNQEAAAGMYHPRSYYAVGNGGTPRLRRREMEVWRSLDRISIFLFCCALLCLILF